MSPPGDPQIPKIKKKNNNKKCASLALIMKEPGDCPPLNINAMGAISVKSFLKNHYMKVKVHFETITPPAKNTSNLGIVH